MMGEGRVDFCVNGCKTGIGGFIEISRRQKQKINIETTTGDYEGQRIQKGQEKVTLLILITRANIAPLNLILIDLW